jgi:hypothetical protein
MWKEVFVAYVNVPSQYYHGELTFMYSKREKKYRKIQKKNGKTNSETSEPRKTPQNAHFLYTNK